MCIKSYLFRFHLFHLHILIGHDLMSIEILIREAVLKGWFTAKVKLGEVFAMDVL